MSWVWRVGYLFDVGELPDVGVLGGQFLADERGEEVLVVVDVAQPADGQGFSEGLLGEIAEARPR